MRKVILLVVSCLLLVVSSLQAEAADPGGKFSFSNSMLGGSGSSFGKLEGDLSNGISLGFIKAGSVEVGSISWRPNYKYGAWGLGFDVNVPIGNQRPDGYDSLVFRYAEYDDGQKGLRYGVLDGITWGHGLLVKNYTTRLAGPVILNNNQMGIRGFYNWDNYGVTALNTWSHIYGVRVTEKIKPVEFLPLITFGQGYICDTNGLSVKQTDGTTRSFPSQAGVELDATMPLPFGFNGYGEYARLMNYGQGASVGVDWGVDFLAFAATFDVGYRSMSSRFAPGYFDTDYEINPTDLTSIGASSRNGYFAGFKGIMSDYLKLNIQYEAYQGANTTLLAEALSIPREDVSLYAYYSQPKFVDFNSLTLEEGAVIGAKVGYKVNPNTMIVTHYKKAYNPTLGKVEETQWYEIELSF